jgi:hypothetical protein
MNKRLLKTIFAMACPLLFATCTSSDKGITDFTTKIDASASRTSSDALAYSFSTDGKTYTQFPSVAVGTKLWVKIADNTTGQYINNYNYFGLDWSLSNPKPTNEVTSDNPTFIVGSVTQLSVAITDYTYCPFIPAKWTGDWGGDEVGACCGGTDPNTFTMDSSNPNKFTADNFWGIGSPWYIVFTPSTSTADQVVAMPSQSIDASAIGGTSSTGSGTGTYDQCKGTFTLNVTYVVTGGPNAGTYPFAYNFHR